MTELFIPILSVASWTRRGFPSGLLALPTHPPLWQFQPNMRTQYSAQYNLNIQRELAKDLVLPVGYVGSQGHRNLATHDINLATLRRVLTCMTSLSPVVIAVSTADSLGRLCLHCSGKHYSAGMTLHLPYGSVRSITGPNTNDITW